MAAPVGAIVGISPYDLWDGPPPPSPGDILVTVGKNERLGTAYRILTARHMTQSKEPYRFSLRCQVMGPAATVDLHEPGVTVYTIVWNRRDRKRPR